METAMEATTHTASAPNKAKINAANVASPHCPSICPGAQSGIRTRNIGTRQQNDSTETRNAAQMADKTNKARFSLMRRPNQ